MKKPVPEHYGFTELEVKSIGQKKLFIFLFATVINFFKSYNFFDKVNLYSVILWFLLVFIYCIIIHIIVRHFSKTYRNYLTYEKELKKYNKQLRKFGIKTTEEEVKILNINTEFNQNLSPLKLQEIDDIKAYCENEEWIEFFSNGIKNSTPITFIDKLFYYKNNGKEYISGIAGLKGNEILIIGEEENIQIHYGDYNKKYFTDIYADDTNIEYSMYCKVAIIMTSEQLEYPNNLYKTDYFGMSHDNTYKFKNHFEKNNLENEEKRELFVLEVNKSLEKIKQDVELNSFLLKYITKFPANMFLSPTHLTMFENSILQNDFKGEHVLLSRGTWEGYIQEMINKTSEYYTENGLGEDLWDYSIDIPYDRAKLEEIKTYRSSYFSMIEEVMQKKRYFRNNTHCIFGTWRFIYSAIIDVYAKKWLDYYGDYFNNIENMTLDNCIAKYIKIKNLNHQDDKILAMFTYFLIYFKKFSLGIHSQNFLKTNSFLVDRVNYFLSNTEEIALKENEIILSELDKSFCEEICELFENSNYSVDKIYEQKPMNLHMIVKKENEIIGIHSKNYNSDFPEYILDNIMENAKELNIEKILIISKSKFSNSLIRTARKNNISIWDDFILKEKRETVFFNID